ncbi:tudor domain-containing protein 1 [Lingula anatina]|uniref:Tudor domain-containing protein 1 n=1 Tax=Lingula anatina TaxID=7574 RepID=A0A1S3K2U7_LINAN|nr:tudor domain-containing protein 1 [Lingula anatina]|eukprot:XP_013416965.1 tudor domain-containing protein 1 [Lingula anatina]
MVEDHLSNRNTYAIDPDDPGVATTGHASYEEKMPCKFFMTPEGCWRGQECPFPHVAPGSVVTEEHREVFSVEDVENTVCPAENSWVAVEITSLYNPSHFYVTFPFGTRPLQHFISNELSDDGYEGSIGSEALELLMEEINEDYSSSVYRDTDLVGHACGEIVVAQFSDDDLWYRAKVIDTDMENEKVEVFYMDFGNTEWVSESRLRTIKKHYLELPFQAVECFLAGVEATSEDGTWTREGKEHFSQTTDGKVLFAKVVKRFSNCAIQVQLYDSSGETDVNIADALVESGYAKRTTDTVSPSSPKGNQGLKEKIVSWVPG